MEWVFTSMSHKVQGLQWRLNWSQPENATILIIKICTDFESENDQGTNFIDPIFSDVTKLRKSSPRQLMK